MTAKKDSKSSRKTKAEKAAEANVEPGTEGKASIDTNSPSTPPPTDDDPK